VKNETAPELFRFMNMSPVPELLAAVEIAPIQQTKTDAFQACVNCSLMESEESVTTSSRMI